MNFRLLFSLLILLCAQLIVAQNLTLEKEGRQKDIPIGSYLEFKKIIEPSGDCVACQYESYFGQLTKVTRDSFHLNYLYRDMMQNEEGYSIHQTEEIAPSFQRNFSVAAAKADIYSIHYFGKNAKGKKKKTTRQVVGGIAIMTGLTTGLASLLVKDKGDRKKVGLAAAAEVGFGILFLSLSGSRKYSLRASESIEDPWQIKS